MINDLKPYPAMKDSGVPWLGEVPEHWEIARSKRLFRQRKEFAQPEDEQLSATQAYGVIPQAIYEARTGYRVVKISLHLEKRRHVEADDFVISMRSFEGGLERAWSPGAIRSSYVVLKPSQEAQPGFFQYLFKSTPYITALRGTADFIRDGQDLNYDNFCAVALPLIPAQEQTAIVRFLDHADRKIRRYIRAKQKLIKLLEEQKQAIIHRAVTRGLDPNVRLKPSGVEWLGDVPEHWEVKRAKVLFREVDHRTQTGTEELLSLRMYRGLVPHRDVSVVPIGADALVGFKRVNPGQLVMNRMRAAIGMFGIARQDGLVSPDYAVFGVDSSQVLEYFLLLFKTPAAGGIFRVESKGLGTGSAGFMRLYTDRFGAIKIPVPPVVEQKEIVNGINVAITDTESTIDRLRRETDLLHEYRTRLIADVVTGKLDVREAAARIPENLGDEQLEGSDYNEEDDDIEPTPELQEGYDT